MSVFDKVINIYFSFTFYTTQKFLWSKQNILEYIQIWSVIKFSYLQQWYSTWSRIRIIWGPCLKCKFQSPTPKNMNKSLRKDPEWAFFTSSGNIQTGGPKMTCGEIGDTQIPHSGFQVLYHMVTKSLLPKIPPPSFPQCMPVLNWKDIITLLQQKPWNFVLPICQISYNVNRELSR